MSEVVIDGKRYVAADSLGGEIKIIVLERGFVYVGQVKEELSHTVIHNARAIIRWGTTKHLGELTNGPLENTKLGDRCTINVKDSKIIHTIEVNQNAWK